MGARRIANTHADVSRTGGQAIPRTQSWPVQAYRSSSGCLGHLETSSTTYRVWDEMPILRYSRFLALAFPVRGGKDVEQYASKAFLQFPGYLSRYTYTPRIPGFARAFLLSWMDWKSVSVSRPQLPPFPTSLSPIRPFIHPSDRFVIPHVTHTFIPLASQGFTYPSRHVWETSQGGHNRISKDGHSSF